MSQSLISVIVPIYKVEKYLDRCVQSIVDQTYANLEIILVDDGSPDNCGIMCDEWALRDRRIKVIHKENGGLSDARNAGMAAATGEYMGFVDGDDYISPDMYQLLYERMISDDSDISACGVELVYEDGSPRQNLTTSGSCVLGNSKAIEAVIRESWLKQPVWYKLYKTELIRDIHFPVGKCHEDVFWTWQAVARAEKVSVFDRVCYFYVQRSGSIMGEGYSLKRLDALEALERRFLFIEQHYPDLVLLEKQKIIFLCIYDMQMSLKYLKGESLRATKEKIRHVLKQIGPVYSAKGLSKKSTMWLYMANLSFVGTCWLRNLLNIGY